MISALCVFLARERGSSFVRRCVLDDFPICSRLLRTQRHIITNCAFNIMSSLLFSSIVAFSRAGGSFCKASSSSSSSSSPSSSRTTTTTKSVRFDFRSPRRRRTTNETTTTTYATTSQNDDGNTKNNNDENLMSARELKRKLEELVRCF